MIVEPSVCSNVKSSVCVRMEISGQELIAAENEQQKRKSDEMRGSSDGRAIAEERPQPKRGFKGKFSQLG